MKNLIKKFRLCIDILKSKPGISQFNFYNGFYDDAAQKRDLTEWFSMSDHFICLGIRFDDKRAWVMVSNNKVEHTRIMFDALIEHVRNTPHFQIINDKLQEKIATQALIPLE